MGPSLPLAAEELERGGRIKWNDLLAPSPAEEFLQLLDLAIDAGGPQFLGADEVLTVIGEIDGADAAQADVCSPRLFDPAPEQPQIGRVVASARSAARRLRTKSRISEETTLKALPSNSLHAIV